ncbi:MAG: sel1 repeat family protein, partial [Betaproteobacteria bacterium]|nr:sel1 repeat family protein [Betaproteobacteria bacterium]
YDYHLELGATSGDAYAMYSLAYHRLKQVKEGDDAQPWVDLLKRAAEKGESYSCMHLGLIYRNGYHGCTRDAEVSTYWLKKSASLGYEMACAALGRYLLEEDEETGRMYLKRGAMLGEAYGQSVLGNHLTWCGKSPEEQLEGVQWLRAAAQQGHRPARWSILASPYSSSALAWFSGLVVTCQPLPCGQGYLLGLTYENGDGTTQDPVQAFKCYQLAAEKGITKGVFKLGMAYLWGEGVEQDIPAGAKWLKKAANEGNADAQAYLGMLFVYGHGVQENTDIALYWLRQAAKSN